MSVPPPVYAFAWVADDLPPGRRFMFLSALLAVALILPLALSLLFSLLLACLVHRSPLWKLASSGWS